MSCRRLHKLSSRVTTRRAEFCVQAPSLHRLFEPSPWQSLHELAGRGAKEHASTVRCVACCAPMTVYCEFGVCPRGLSSCVLASLCAVCCVLSLSLSLEAVISGFLYYVRCPCVCMVSVRCCTTIVECHA